MHRRDETKFGRCSTPNEVGDQELEESTNRMEKELGGGTAVSRRVGKVARRVGEVLAVLGFVGAGGYFGKSCGESAYDYGLEYNLANDIRLHKQALSEFLNVQMAALEGLNKDSVITPVRLPVKIHLAGASNKGLVWLGLGGFEEKVETVEAMRFVTGERRETWGEIWLSGKGDVMIFRVPWALDWSKEDTFCKGECKSEYFVVRIEEDAKKDVKAFHVGHFTGALVKEGGIEMLNIINPSKLGTGIDLKSYSGTVQLDSEEWQKSALKVLALLRQMQAKEETLAKNKKSLQAKTEAKDLEKTLQNGTVRMNVKLSNGNWASGTGFIVAPDTLVTAKHVVADVGENNNALLFSVESYVPARGSNVALQPIWFDGNSSYAIVSSKAKDLSVVVFNGKIFPANKALKISAETVTNGDNFVFGHLVFDNKYNLWKKEQGAATAVIDQVKDFNYLIKFDVGVERGNSGGPVTNIRGEVVSLAARICDYNQNADLGKLCGPRVTSREVEQMTQTGRDYFKKKK